MEKRTLILLLAPLLLAWHWFEPAARKNQQGIRAYEEKKFQQSLQLFLEAKGLKPDAPQLGHNTAAALYQLKKYKEALDEFGRIDAARSGLPAGRLHFNMGNTHFRLQQYDKALEEFKQCLLTDPGDLDAKKNLELTLKKMNEQKQQQQPQNPPPQKLEQKPDYKPLMQFLNQNERQQQEKRKRRSNSAANNRDW
jgi:Ca-activated chloride channel homolog